jgi:uncharacterized phage protein (TIGR02218 family)
MTADALYAHLEGGTTTVCRAWTVRLRNGTEMGFTDHDRDLVVDGVPCRADTGLTARALQQTTGLSVDNSEAVGALSDAAIREADLVAGRYDGAEVRAYLVNWAAPGDWVEQFRGSLGEITRAGPSFRAELRGLSALLNRAQGYAYQRGCSAVLGDARCRFDTAQPGYFADLIVEEVEDGRIFRFGSLTGFDERWFEHGRFEVVTGAGAGLVGQVRSDRFWNGLREMELWESIRADITTGDRVRVIAGCDKSFATCRTKFLNTLNYRGFPHIPGEDLLSSYPVPERPNPGGPRLTLPGFP